MSSSCKPDWLDLCWKNQGIFNTEGGISAQLSQKWTLHLASVNWMTLTDWCAFFMLFFSCCFDTWSLDISMKYQGIALCPPARPGTLGREDSQLAAVHSLPRCQFEAGWLWVVLQSHGTVYWMGRDSQLSASECHQPQSGTINPQRVLDFANLKILSLLVYCCACLFYSSILIECETFRLSWGLLWCGVLHIWNGGTETYESRGWPHPKAQS